MKYVKREFVIFVGKALWRLADALGRNPPATGLRPAALPPLTRGARLVWRRSEKIRLIGKIHPLAPLSKGGKIGLEGI